MFKNTLFLPVVFAPVQFLTSYALNTQVMLILILIDVQYLHNVIFSFEKGLNGQNHSSSDSHHDMN